jgi:hypothetical protein
LESDCNFGDSDFLRVCVFMVVVHASIKTEVYLPADYQ